MILARNGAKMSWYEVGQRKAVEVEEAHLPKSSGPMAASRASCGGVRLVYSWEILSGGVVSLQVLVCAIAPYLSNGLTYQTGGVYVFGIHFL